MSATHSTFGQSRRKSRSTRSVAGSPPGMRLVVRQRLRGLIPARGLRWNAMKEGPLGATLHSVHRGASSRRPVFMLHAGLDLSRKRLDVCLLSDQGELVEEF